MVASVLMKIRALCDSTFEVLSEKERIYKYTTPKVHRLLQVLKTYTPYYNKVTNTSNNDVNNENNSKHVSVNNEKSSVKDNSVQTRKPESNWRSGEENYRKPSKSQRHVRGVTDPDLLCGVIFVDTSFVAKVLFYLLNETSSHDEDLHFLSPLYTD